MRLFQNISIVIHFIILYKDLLIQKKVTKGLLSGLPNKVSDSKKYYSYSTLIVTGVSQVYTMLRGKDLTRKERQTQTYLSFLAAIVDEEIDKQITSLDQLESFLSSMETERSLVLENIYFLVKKILSNSVGDKKEIIELLKYSLLFQLDSLRQSKENDETALKQITWNKCGYAFMLSRMLLQQDCTETEKEFCYQYGGIGQLGDDLLDVYDDQEDGICTLAHLISIDELEGLYHAELEQCFSLLQELTYSEKNKRKTKRRLAIISAIPLVGFDLLKKNKIETGVTFDYKKVKRSETICDMQKLKNGLACFQKINSLMR
ncbi:MAG: hypothetical protein AB8B61_04800 [Cyclobacteriaceae bacterium]